MTTAAAPVNAPVNVRQIVPAQTGTVGYSLASPPSKKAAFGWTALGTAVGLGLGAALAAAMGKHKTAALAIGALVGGASTAAIVTPNS